MKTMKLTAALLAVSIALASCTGDDGEPGPKGDTGAQGATGANGAAGPAGEGIEKVGYFQGTVTGKNTSGTDFSETFKLEYGLGSQAFYESAGNKWISLYRYNAFYYYTSRFEVSSLQLSGNTLVVVPNMSNISFIHTKERSATDLFTVTATPYFKDRESYVVRLSEDQNTTYNFVTGEGNIYYNTGTWSIGGNSVLAYIFYDKNYNYEIYYSYTDGSLLGYYDQTTELQVTSGTVFNLYNKLSFKTNASLNALTFYDKGTKNSLHSIVPATPADQFIVSNYVHDATTGNLSFDYTLKISKYRSRTGGNYGTNSTGNDLVISGSFNSGGKVYKNIVSRTSSGG